VAELLGIGKDGERAIRRLVALMALCCDPSSIALNGHDIGAAVGPRPRAAPQTWGSAPGRDCSRWPESVLRRGREKAMAFYEHPATKEARWNDFLRRLRQADKELPPIKPAIPEAPSEQLVTDRANPRPA
jgi:hypothetical protein